MFARTRIGSFIARLCFASALVGWWCATLAEAQHVHRPGGCGYGPLLPAYSHGHFRSEFSAVWLTPMIPIWVVPTVAIAPLDPRFVPIPAQPLAPTVPIQTENFARENVTAPVNALGEPSKMAIGGALWDAGPVDELDEIRRRVTVLKRSTPQGRTRADRLISAADASFRKQSYARAVAQYRDAISRAPDYAEGHFRLAHAYVATRRFNLAQKSAMTAFELSGTARRDGFSLDELYQGNKFAREQHDSMLFDAALREPADGGLQFLIGFTLHYDRQPLKAREHFRKANQLAGAHQAYVRHFLPVVPIAESNELAMEAN